ncbi:MAG: helicase-associated domain-containing protein [Chloroflexota bacterium]
MQINQLIARLEPDELAQLLIRHRLDPHSTNVEQLPDIMAHRGHLHGVLTELNQTELTIIRWLAQQEGLRASWDHLVDTINHRLTDVMVHNLLQNLKLYGLLDYEAHEGTGWVATYEAVATSTAVSQGISLNSALTGLTTEMLAAICTRLSISPVPKAKADRLRAIESVHANHDRLHVTLRNLSKEARELFEWIHARGGVADHTALSVKLKDGYYFAISYVSRALTGYGATNAAHGSPFIELLERALVVGVSAYGNNWGYASYFAIPGEVITAYSGTSVFDTVSLLPPPLETVTPVRTSVPNQTTLLRDLAHIRAFIALGRVEWRQDGEPYARSLQTLSKLIKAPTKDYGFTLWKLALQVPLVYAGGYGNDGFEVMDFDPEVTPDDLIRNLIDGWVEAGDQAMMLGTLPGSEPEARVLTLLRQIPADTWVTRESFSRLLAFCWPLVFPTPGSGAATVAGDWSTLYATMLSQGHDESGNEAFQVVSSALEVVCPSDIEGPPMLPAWDTSWVVQPDRTVIAPPNAHPDAILDLWSVAEITDNQGASIFRVTPDSISAALNRGMTPAEVEAVFRRHSRTPLPATIERVIQDQGRRYGQVRVGAASTYLQVDDPAVLDEIAHSAKLSKLRIQILAPTVGIVLNADDPAVMTALRKAGYLPVSAGPTATPTVGGTSQPIILHPKFGGNGLVGVILEAIRDTRLIRARWTEPHGQTESRVLEPESIQQTILVAYDAETGEPWDLDLTTVVSVTLLSAKEAEKYYL